MILVILLFVCFEFTVNASCLNDLLCVAMFSTFFFREEPKVKVGEGGLKERRVIRVIWVLLALADSPGKMEFQVSQANPDTLENQ